MYRAMGLFDFLKKKEECEPVVWPTDPVPPVEEPPIEEPPVEEEEPPMTHNVGCICALIHLYGKEEPVKATFYGCVDIDPILKKHFDIVECVVTTARQKLEDALKQPFILADFDFYYPTTAIAKVELQCHDFFVEEPSMEEPVE